MLIPARNANLDRGCLVFLSIFYVLKFTEPTPFQDDLFLLSGMSILRGNI
jgi:hypothetical protein